MSLFELTAIGGPWAKRLARRRAATRDLGCDELAREAHDPDLRERARLVWTRSAFSEYASAAAFAAIATELLAAAAPIDLVAASGDFVADEILHAELASRLAMALGGAAPLEVDLAKLVRPPSSERPLLRAAELVVRTCCVGESLTVPVLKAARRAAGSPVVAAVLGRIVRDESAHAELGGWFLDWADPMLTDADRAHLGRVARGALDGFAPVLSAECGASGLGALDCDAFDGVFHAAVTERVVEPLAERGIVVPRDAPAAPGRAQ